MEHDRSVCAMEDIIAQLVELEKVDLELLSVAKRLKEIPAEISAREKSLADAVSMLERLRSECAKLQTEMDANDVEIKSGEEILARYRKQLGMCKSSKEVAAIRNQMKTQQAWIDQYVEKGMSLMQEMEKKKAEAEKIQKEVEASKAAVEEMRIKASAESAELKAKESELRAMRERLAAKIPSDEMAVYDGAMMSRGNALARVEKGSICSACYMRLPPQVHNLVMLRKALVTCPSCGRILAP